MGVGVCIGTGLRVGTTVGVCLGVGWCVGECVAKRVGIRVTSSVTNTLLGCEEVLNAKGSRLTTTSRHPTTMRSHFRFSARLFSARVPFATVS